MAISHEMIIKTINITTALLSRLLNGPNIHSDVTKTILKLDIEATTRTAEALIQELGNDMLKRKSIKVCLRYLHKSIDELNTELQKIHSALEVYANSYFQWFRTPNIDLTLQKAICKFGTLQQRLNMLIKLLQTNI